MVSWKSKSFIDDDDKHDDEYDEDDDDDKHYDENDEDDDDENENYDSDCTLTLAAVAASSKPLPAGHFWLLSAKSWSSWLSFVIMIIMMIAIYIMMIINMIINHDLYDLL